MAVHASHAALPFPIKGARFSVIVPMLDADGDPAAQVTPDTEISEDNAAATDAAEEVSATSGMDGMGLITFTGAETDCSCLAVNYKASSGPKATLMTLYPRVLASVGTGTLSAGSAGGGTLGTILAYDVTGCFIKTTGGTGGGGTGGANNQARKIITYTISTGAFTVEPNWETTPSTDTTYVVLLPEGVTLGMLKALNPTTAGRTLDVSTGGEAGLDWANVGSPTTTLGLTNTTVGIITTYTNNTPQTGDAYAIVNNGTHGNAAIKGFVDDIGTAGAGLTAVPWNAAWDAEVESEVTDALSAYDPPTNAEMVARTIAAASYATEATLTTVAGYLDLEIAAILEDTGTTLPAQISALSIPSAATIASTILAAGNVDGYTLEQTLKLCLAALAGKISGADGATVTIRAANDSKTRLTASVDATGRTSVTLDAS